MHKSSTQHHCFSLHKVTLILALGLASATSLTNVTSASADSRRPAPPSAPKTVTAKPGTDSALVSWTKPTSNGGTPITKYVATAIPSGKTCTTSKTSCTISGLVSHDHYVFEVIATNSRGRSPSSKPSKPVVPVSQITTPTSTSSTTTTTTTTPPVATTTPTEPVAPPTSTTTTTTTTIPAPVPTTTPTSSPLSDAQNDNGSVYWGFDQNAAPTSIRQTFSVLRLAPSTFWALSFYSPYAYMGFQTDSSGNPDVALFSIWGGTNATPGPGSTCQAFGNEGTGENCLLPLNFSTATSYTYSLTNAGGTTWSASITDVATGVTYLIGTITAPTGESTISGVSDFSEYFGNNFVCNMSSMSTVQWSPPVASASTPTPYTQTATYAGNDRNGENNCSSWSVIETTVNNEPVVDASLGDVAS